MLEKIRTQSPPNSGGLKAVKPGEDINENDRLIFCCWHPFFKIYTQKLCTQLCRAGPATQPAKQWFCSKNIRIIKNLFR